MILNTSGIFLFGFTYLYVGIANVWGFDTSGLGWYCLWVVIIAIAYSLLNCFYFGAWAFDVIWLMCSFPWTHFFVLLASKGRSTGSPDRSPWWRPGSRAWLPRFCYSPKGGPSAGKDR